MNQFSLYLCDGEKLGEFEGDFSGQTSPVGEYIVRNIDTDEELVIDRKDSIDYYYQDGIQIGWND